MCKIHNAEEELIKVIFFSKSQEPGKKNIIYIYMVKLRIQPKGCPNDIPPIHDVREINSSTKSISSEK